MWKNIKKEPLLAALLINNGFKSLSLDMLVVRLVPVLSFHFVELYAVEMFRQEAK